MPPPKKAAGKTPAKSSANRDKATDVRRAHEHEGRIEVLLPLLGENTGDVELLVMLSNQELSTSHPKAAADLLRAAEHLCFGLLASSRPDANAHPALSESVEQEFQHRLINAEEHWDNSRVLDSIYQRAIDGAQSAFQGEAYQKALELARAADAIAHVHLHDEEDE